MDRNGAHLQPHTGLGELNMKSVYRTLARLAGLFLVLAIIASSVHGPVLANNGEIVRTDTYRDQEILNAGHQFFGSVSGELATAMEKVFSTYGEPNGYILGEEGAGAFVAGARFGEGELYTRNAGQHKVFWQGPSIGWDFGGDGARVMMLVYDLPAIEAMYRRYLGVNGSAFVVGGFGVSVVSNNNILVVPVRAGVGARLGINVGYLKFTDKPTWNPF